MSDTKVTVTFSRQEMDDDSPDLSYLEQDCFNDPKEGKPNYGFERLAAYGGDWHMIGIRAVATIWVQRVGYQANYTIKSHGLWGIESDSEESYLQSVYKEECSQLQADIAAMGAAEFKL